MNVKVEVTLRRTVHDPQGESVTEAVRRAGYDFVKDVRVGKLFLIDIEGDGDAVQTRLEQLSQDFLSNPIIEDFKIL
jgi:phosphoribosylformylglycinamidine synthase